MPGLPGQLNEFLVRYAKMMGLPHLGVMIWSNFFATKEAAAYQQGKASTQGETYRS